MSLPADGEAWNAGEALLARARERGDRPIYRCEGRVLDGDTLARRTFGAQLAFDRAGLIAGDRLLLLLLDTESFPACFLASLRSGILPIPVSTLLPEKDVAFIARDAAVRGVVVDRRLPDSLAEARLYPDGCRVLRSDALENANAPDPGVASTLASDDAFWLYTSGTTGRPKGAIHRHRDLPYTAEHYAREILELGSGDRVLSAAKLFFAYGLGNSLTFPLWLGAEAVLIPDRPTPESVYRAIDEERPSVFFGVPTLYAAMLAAADAPERLPSLRLCVSAGEALPAPLFDRFRERFGLEILDGIGSTEMLHIFLSNRFGEIAPGSSGTPVPGYRVRIVDEDDRDVPDGAVGSLLAWGGSAARAYHGLPEQSARTMFAPDWLRTGDSYRREAGGQYVHVGRSDELLKVSGQWVSPLEVESALLEHSAVLEAAVVGDLDENGLTKPRAFVVLRPGERPDDALADALRRSVKERLTPHKYPRWIDFVDTLPKTATGKIQRFALRGKGEADGSSV